MPKLIPPGLVIRQTLPADLPSLTDLLVLTPDDGTLYQFPYILEYPDDIHELNMGWLRPALQDTTILIRVAVMLVAATRK